MAGPVIRGDLPRVLTGREGQSCAPRGLPSVRLRSRRWPAPVTEESRPSPPRYPASRGGHAAAGNRLDAAAEATGVGPLLTPLPDGAILVATPPQRCGAGCS